MTLHSEGPDGPVGPGRLAIQMETAERRAHLFRLVQGGRTYRQVAEMESAAGRPISRSRVHQICKEMLAEVTEAPAREQIQLALSQLDALLEPVWGAATGLESLVERLREQGIPHEETVDLVKLALVAHEQARKVLADRRKMLGLEAPKKLEITSSGDLSSDSLERAQRVLQAPRGRVRELILRCLEQPTPEWVTLLASAGYRRDLSGGENRSQVSVPAAIAEQMLDAFSDSAANPEKPTR